MELYTIETRYIKTIIIMQNINIIERLFCIGCELSYRWGILWSKKRINKKSMYKNISEPESICISFTASLYGAMICIDVFYISFGICELLPIVIAQRWKSIIAMVTVGVVLLPSIIWWYKAKFAQVYPAYKQIISREKTCTRVLWFLLFGIICLVSVIIPFIVVTVVRHISF